MSINQRIKSILDEKKISGKKAALDLEIDYRQFNNWLNQTKPSVEGLQKILKYFPDVDARWLLTGEAAAPVKAKTYKNETELDVVNEGSGCCRRCKDLEKQIALQEELLDHYRGKKETSAESSATSCAICKGCKKINTGQA